MGEVATRRPVLPHTEAPRPKRHPKRCEAGRAGQRGAPPAKAKLVAPPIVLPSFRFGRVETGRSSNSSGGSSIVAGGGGGAGGVSFSIPFSTLFLHQTSSLNLIEPVLLDVAENCPRR